MISELPPLWDHQVEALERSRDLRIYALLFEQRCGKSRVAIETKQHQFYQGCINASLIMTWPNSTKWVWVDEIADFLSPTVPRMVVVWQANAQLSRQFNEEFNKLLKFQGLAVFIVNSEAISRKLAAVKKYIHAFIEARKIFLIMDECDSFKTPGAKRTLTMGRIAKRPNIVSKRILTGTPSTESPFELYAQFNLLDRRILDCPSFIAFKHRYAEYEDEKGYNHNTNTVFEILARDEQGRIKYRNLDDLHKRIAPYSMRVLRSEVSNAPAKIYQRRYYELSKEQRRVYDNLRDKFYIELQQTEWNARNVLVRMIRLQQVLSNYLPERIEGVVCSGCEGNGCEECDFIGIIETNFPPVTIDQNENLRLNALSEELEENIPTLIFARFVPEIELIQRSFPNRRLATFYGKVPELERQKARVAFKNGELDIIVIQSGTGGRGLAFDRAEKVIFFSNTFSLRTRLQCEDRPESIMKKTATGVIDITARDSIDETIVQAYRDKMEISSLVTGDPQRKWL